MKFKDNDFKWIDIKEQLPPLNQYVVIYLKRESIAPYRQNRYYVDRLFKQSESDGGGVDFEHFYFHNVICWLSIPQMEEN